MLGVDDRDIAAATEEVSFKVEGYAEADRSRATVDMEGFK